MAQRDQVLGGQVGALPAHAVDRVKGAGVVGVDHHHRHARPLQLPQDGLVRGKRGKQDAVRRNRVRDAEIFHLHRELPARIEQGDGVALLKEKALHLVGHLGIKRILDVRHDQHQIFSFLGLEALGDAVGAVMEPLHHLADTAGGLLVHITGAVQITGDSGGGDLCFFGNITDRDGLSHCSPPLCKV